MSTTTATGSRREDIVLAAAARFLEHGFGGTSLRDIAADCGIKAGSIYYHFDGKESLLEQVLRDGVGAMSAAFDEVAVSAAELPAHDRVRAHVAAHLSVLFEGGPVTAAHVSAFRTLPASVREAVIPVRDAYEERWATLLDELQRAGDIAADVDLTLARLVLFGGMNFATEWYDPSRGDLDGLTATVARQFWSGVGARTGSDT